MKSEAVRLLVETGVSHKDANECVDLYLHAMKEAMDKMKSIAIMASNREVYVALLRQFALGADFQANYFQEELKGFGIDLDMMDKAVSGPELDHIRPDQAVGCQMAADKIMELINKTLNRSGIDMHEHNYIVRIIGARAVSTMMRRK